MGIKLTPKKWRIDYPEVNYLGCQKLVKGVCPDQGKSKDVHNFPVSNDVCAVWSLAGYYRHFVPIRWSPLFTHSPDRKFCMPGWSDAMKSSSASTP